MPHTTFTADEQRRGAPEPDWDDALSSARGLTVAALISLAMMALIGAVIIAAWIR